jgi:DNA end-binding protein Ku
MGLVICPVQMFAVDESHDRKASTYHAHDDGSYGKVRQPKTCEGCGAVLAAGDISKGFEENGQMVMLSDDEMETVAVNSGDAVEISKFVKADEINPMLFAGEKAYRLVPDPKRGGQAASSYAVIRQDIIDNDLVGIVQYTRWGRNRMAVLCVEPTDDGGVLVVRNMMWPDELRAATFPVLESFDTSTIDPRLAPVARSVIESMTAAWNPDDYADTYTEALNAAIQAKAEGNEIAAITSAQGGSIDDVSDLLAKLEASAAAKAPAKKAPAKRKKVA